MKCALRKGIASRVGLSVTLLCVLGNVARGEQVPTPTAQKRVAFVIGNSNYMNEGWLPLPGPFNDATDIAAKLTQLGFQVFGPYHDLTRDEFAVRAAEFMYATRALQPGDLSVVFYAGHGASVSGQSFIIPTDMPGGNTVMTLRLRDWERLAVSVDKLVDKLRRDGLISVLFLNNCLNAFPSLGGFTRVARPAQADSTPDKQSYEMLISYATAPGQCALPAKKGQRNTPYGAALLAHIDERGLELRPLMRRLAADVAVEAGDYQRPTYDDWLKTDRYLAGEPRPWQRRWFLPVTVTLGTVAVAGLVVGLVAGLRDDRQVYQPSFPK